MDYPTTQYAERHGSLIAYQVLGEGPTDLILSLGLASNCDHLNDVPQNRKALQRLSTFFRLIVFDRRGTGHSDPLPLDALPTWEEWADDMLTVMDAAGSRQAIVHGDRDGGIMAMLFAALHPERTVALSLGNTSARYLEAPDYPIGLSREQAQGYLELIATQWGTMAFARQLNFDYDVDSLYHSARLMRGAATPRQAAAHFRYMFDFDARAVLPSINVPTLVLHRSAQALLPIEHGRYIARHIPEARMVELPGAEVTSLFSANEKLDAVHALVEFALGSPVDAEPHRALVTVLFCDIVDSTRLAASLGDTEWHALLNRFYALVRGELVRTGGREIDTAGDGVFMAFDRPTRAIRCAIAIRDAVRSLDVEIRSGLHAGECTVTADGLSGMAVHVGARVAAAAEPGEVWVSETVRALTMGSGIGFLERGVHRFKGIDGRWRLYAVQNV